MKRLYTYTFLILLTLSMNSCFFSCQDLHFSPAVGLDSSQFSEEDVSPGSENGGGSLIGFQLGLDAIVPINPQLGLESGLRLAGKGNKTGMSGDGYSYSDKTPMTYLDVPVLARYGIGESGFSVYGGIQPSVLLGAKRKSDGSEGGSNSETVTDNFKTLDMAGSLGAGYQFANGIRLNLGYDHGFSNIAKDNTLGMGKINNRTLKLTLGYTFGKIDGIFGKQTEKALQKFQRNSLKKRKVILRHF